MNINSSPNSPDNQEIDLSQISKSIGRFFDDLGYKCFQVIQFVKKNIVIIGVLTALGFVLGYLMDRNSKTYKSEIIVKPNFESGDYLYDKIDLIKAKISDGDTIFLRDTVGISMPKKFLNIEIEPINDIYKFVENKESNFEMIKLMAENSDLKKIMEDLTTSKNFMYHKISLVSKTPVTEENLTSPILKYLEDSEYLNKKKIEYLNNAKVKMSENDSMIKQINNLLDSFTSAGKSNSSSVYINQNTQINDIIKSKESFINENGYLRIEILNYDKIIKKVSSNLSKKNTSFLDNNNKIILPILFVLLFCFFQIIRKLYKKQKLKAMSYN